MSTAVYHDAPVLVPCPGDEDCPDADSYTTHAHVRDYTCACGHLLLIEGVVADVCGSEGVEYTLAREWIVTCAACGVHHVLVEAPEQQ